MSTLWAVFRAPNVGTYADRQYGSGWSHTIHFSSLSNLLDQMAQRENLHQDSAPRLCAVPRPLVTRLGIAAHGEHTASTLHAAATIFIDGLFDEYTDIAGVCRQALVTLGEDAIAALTKAAQRCTATAKKQRLLHLLRIAQSEMPADEDDLLTSVTETLAACVRSSDEQLSSAALALLMELGPGVFADHLVHDAMALSFWPEVCVRLLEAAGKTTCPLSAKSLIQVMSLTGSRDLDIGVAALDLFQVDQRIVTPAEERARRKRMLTCR